MSEMSESDTESVEPDLETENDAPDWSNEIPSDQLLAAELGSQLAARPRHLLGREDDDDKKKAELLDHLKGEE